MKETWKGLQPLRVAPGWGIDMNSLYAVAPSAGTMEWFYGSVLLSGHDRHSLLCFDARWEPEGDPEGCYAVDFLRPVRHGKRRTGQPEKPEAPDAVELIGTWSTRSRPDLVTMLETFMFTRELPRGCEAGDTEGGPTVSRPPKPKL